MDGFSYTRIWKNLGLLIPIAMGDLAFSVVVAFERLVLIIFWSWSISEMSQRGLIYSFVAKGTVVLAEHTSYSGNFSTIAVQCLQKLPSNSSKYTYSCDGHTFNFLIDNGFVFLVVADESTGRSVPFVFLERVKDDFKQRYGASINNGDAHPLADDDDDDDLFEDRFSIAYNLDREFGPRLKEHMQYCMNHPEEMSKLSKLKAQITEVKGIMMDNIEKTFGCYMLPCMISSGSRLAGFNDPLLSGYSFFVFCNMKAS
ncbi:vesicle-associated membrane protein 727 [Senna tora]|uniref:Vesicle-associated membrane protein 727 n=1 Tax=Senna tora TaxID=362788 RepID=A0A834SWU7_9FABA|nr:vesicle-associated membrane protein 727 [Senna tora]